jgi:hypothetical protein
MAAPLPHPTHAVEALTTVSTCSIAPGRRSISTLTSRTEPTRPNKPARARVGNPTSYLCARALHQRHGAQAQHEHELLWSRAAQARGSRPAYADPLVWTTAARGGAARTGRRPGPGAPARRRVALSRRQRSTAWSPGTSGSWCRGSRAPVARPPRRGQPRSRAW